MMLFRIFAVAALALSGWSELHAQTASPLASKSPDASAISAAVQRRGFARVIIRFAPPDALADMRADNPHSIAAVRASNAVAQDAIIAAHFGSATAPRDGATFPRAIRRFDLTPGFAVNVTMDELNGLAADARVTVINLDRLGSAGLLQSVPLIGMNAVYAAGATGSNQIVAVLDTGVQSDHEFLAGKVVAAGCFSNATGVDVSLCPNGSNMQAGLGSAEPNIPQCIAGGNNRCRHGTHVAGIAAGLNTSQSVGEPTNGVAKGARIFAFQVFTRLNFDSECGGTGTAPCFKTFSSDQISALEAVYQTLNTFGSSHIASVNMSIVGGPLTTGHCDSDPVKPAIDNLRAAGVLTVISAGNDSSTTTTGHPACISSAVSVGSTTKQDTISAFSDVSDAVDLLAPGGQLDSNCSFGANNAEILSSAPDFNGTTATGFYACMAGTSQAAPHVAGAIAVIRSACPNVSADTIENALKATGLPVADQRSGGAFTKPRIRVDQALSAACAAAGGLVNSVLPASRSVQVGQSATAFNTTINTTSGTATSCGLSASAATPVSAGFAYQTTNSATNQVTGTPNTPVDIPAGGSQSYVFAIIPNSAFGPTDISIIANCTNTPSSHPILGVSTILVSASTTPVPDIVALGATISNDGIVNIAGPNGAGAFSVATFNVGSAAPITVSADTGNASLPVTLSVCQSDPSNGNCLASPTPAVSTNIGSGGTPTFSVFASGSGNVPFDPASNRIFVRFKDSGGATRGSTSVAVRTQ